jgi:hypothetical protein
MRVAGLLGGLGSLIMLVFLVAFASPAGTAAASVGPPSAGLAGVWQRRDAWLWVDEHGTTRLRWRTDWCEPGATGPCDRLDERGLTLGAVAEMNLTHAGSTQRSTLQGQVTSVNTPGPLHLGSVSLTRLADDLVVLQQEDQALVLCRPPRDTNFCNDLDEPS